MEDSCDDILRLAPDCDPLMLRFSPAEGFLLSRVDGYTPWRLLREIGGLPADEVDLCLESWLARGILLAGPSNDRAASRPVESASPATDSQRTDPGPPGSTPLPPIDESAIDSSLDLDEDTQRHILEFEAGLSRGYFDLLGLPLNADGRAVKKAYFKLCREFHPDRYFRRDIGAYAAVLGKIFKRVLQAYELLSDDDERAKLVLSLSPAAEVTGAESDGTAAVDPPSDDSQCAGSASQHEDCSQAPPESGGKAAEATATPSPKLSALDRLKQRMPFKISAEHREEGRQKADELYQAALVLLDEARYAEAISSVRVALAFDAGNAQYNETLKMIQHAATEAQLTDLRNRVDSMDASDRLEALMECEQALCERPDDPDLNDLVACFCVHTGDFQRARELSNRAIELDPKAGRYHATLGHAFEGMCDWSKAIDELQDALRLDPRDDDSKRRLKALKWRAKSK